MFKLKNFKILLLLTLFAFAGQNAWADKGQPTYSGWFTYAAKIKVNETGLGKVYGSLSDASAAANPSAAKSATIITRHRYASVTTENQSTNEFTLYLYAVANESTEEGVTYEFVEWQNEKGERVANSNQLNGTASIAKFTTVNHCGPGFNSSQGTSSGNYSQEHQDYHDQHYVKDEETGITVAGDHGVDSTYVAVFRRVYRIALVTASVNDENLGFVQCNPTPFDYGTEVTLLTLPKPESEKGFENKFIGWKKDGEFLRDDNGDIVRDVPLQFTVSEETKGHYEAVYESGFKFFHLVNKSTKRTVNAINDQGSVTDFSSLQLVYYDERLIDAGSVFQINNYKVAGGYPHEFIVQGSNTGDYYTIDPGSSQYITIERNVNDFTWSIHPNGQPVYMADEGEGIVTPNANKEADITHWYIECMDKDLETKENYFSLDPAKLVEVGGKYYTTLRTSWNILFNPEQMTPYIVKSVNETEGTFEMEPITGNIIPAGTPVIIETKSNVVLENRMVPTLTAAASGAVPSGNLLQVSTKYFPNQAAPVANCKGLIKNADGQLAFGGNALSTVNGNEAYLSVANEVVLPKPIPTVTLAQLVANGEVGKTYEVTDLTGIDVVDHDQLLICKDDNGYANKDENTEDYIDYMQRTNGIDTYDQSNWIGLRVPEGKEFTQSVLKKRLKGVVGKLIDKVNPELQLTQVPEDTTGTPASTDLNLYIAASFYGVNHQTGKNDKEYFFVQPKPMELANVEMAQWSGDKFIVPVHDEAHPTWNTAELRGEFEFNGSYMSNVDMSYLQTGHNYNLLPAVVKYKTSETAVDHVYVLGNVNELAWTPSKGVEMYTVDGNVYTATVTVSNVNNGYGYFGFTKKLGADWDGDNGISSYRFGAVADGANYTIFENLLNQSLPLSGFGETKSFEINAGTYFLTVNLTNKTLVVKPATVNAAPRLEGASPRSYVVYPLSLERTTHEENGVITSVTSLKATQVVDVTYYNLTGISSSRPFEGINIVVTRYSDGSTSTAKRLF